MKKQILIVLSVVTGLLAACSTANFAYYDDIYTSSGEKAAPRAAQSSAATAHNAPAVEADSIIYETDENGNLLRTLTYYPGSTEPVITNYTETGEVIESAPVAGASVTYDPDDYYDYAYASRIRRFHTDVYVGWGYYDPFFTNMYWYDYSPASFGLSIYMGYNWWWPGYYYRPYYYSPYWYDYGWRYGWGWYGPYYGCCDPHYHHHHPGCEPIDYYHNHHDPNHSYYYGHRNNVGPSVGNGDRGDLPAGRGNGVGHGNGETNNHYSVTSSPVAFNQRYESIAGATTGVTSSHGGGNSGGNVNPTNNGDSRKDVTSARKEVTSPSNLRPAEVNPQPTNNGGTVKPASSQAASKPATSTVTSPRTDITPSTPATGKTPTTPATTRPTTTPTTITRPATSATATPHSPRTVTRTVVTPSNVTTRPAGTSGSRPTTTRPSSSTTYPSRTYSNPSSSSSTSRPSSNGST